MKNTKRLLAFLAITVITTALMVCVNACAQDKTAKADAQAPQEKTVKPLVAYFSASGVTKALAIDLAEVVQGDLFEIVPEKPYTEADLNWRDENSRSTIEMKKDKSIRPAIKTKVENMDQYKTVYLGFPIWWYIAPTIINTFLESYNFEGKTVITFATSGGSQMGKTLEELKPSAPKANWKDGKVLNHASKDDIKKFVDSMK